MSEWAVRRDRCLGGGWCYPLGASYCVRCHFVVDLPSKGELGGGSLVGGPGAAPREASLEGGAAHVDLDAGSVASEGDAADASERDGRDVGKRAARAEDGDHEGERSPPLSKRSHNWATTIARS